MPTGFSDSSSTLDIDTARTNDSMEPSDHAPLSGSSAIETGANGGGEGDNSNNNGVQPIEPFSAPMTPGKGKYLLVGFMCLLLGFIRFYV